jgi:Methylamine utilization protein MauJ
LDASKGLRITTPARVRRALPDGALDRYFISLLEQYRERPDVLDNLPYQLDFVVETDLLIGDQKPKRKRTRTQWIKSTLPTLPDGHRWLTNVARDPVEYLRESTRNAIIHVRRKPIVDPDNYDDNSRVVRYVP